MVRECMYYVGIYMVWVGLALRRLFPLSSGKGKERLCGWVTRLGEERASTRDPIHIMYFNVL